MEGLGIGANRHAEQSGGCQNSGGLEASFQQRSCGNRHGATRWPPSSPPPRYEKLQRWDDALRAYRLKLEAAPPGSVAHVDALLGQCRCLAALAEWDKLFAVCRSEWSRVEPHVRREMAPIAAHAAWQLGDWGAMRQYVDVVAHGQAAGGAEGAFLSAVIAVKNRDYGAAAGGHPGGRCWSLVQRVGAMGGRHRCLGL